MGMEVLAAAAILGVASSTYSAIESKKSAKKARNAQEAADLEARRIAASQKPMEESATLLTDTGDIGSTLGTLGLMTTADTSTRKKTTGLGTSSAPIGLGIGG